MGNNNPSDSIDGLKKRLSAAEFMIELLHGMTRRELTDEENEFLDDLEKRIEAGDFGSQLASLPGDSEDSLPDILSSLVFRANAYKACRAAIGYAMIMVKRIAKKTGPKSVAADIARAIDGVVKDEAIWISKAKKIDWDSIGSNEVLLATVLDSLEHGVVTREDLIEFAKNRFSFYDISQEAN